jgi:hypothetical protein
MSSTAFSQGAMTVTVSFREPAFQLTQQSHSLQQAVYEQLSGVDSTLFLANFREEGAFSGPTGWLLSVGLLSNTATLRIRAYEYELFVSNPTFAYRGLVEQVLQRVENAIGAAVPTARFKKRFVALFAHYDLPEGSYATMVHPFLGKIPEGIGDCKSRGISFYVANSLFTDQGTVVLDKSAIVDGGLFLQIRCGFDAGEFDLSTTLGNYDRYVREVTTRLGLPNPESQG